jgi:hypothetical protein
MDHSPDQYAEDERTDDAREPMIDDAFFRLLGECRNFVGKDAQLLVEAGGVRFWSGVVSRLAAPASRSLGAHGRDFAAQRVKLGAQIGPGHEQNSSRFRP